ncbi:MAG: hypothetical protein LBV80_04455 [Deltaproteobacteria bacterium]|jgi:tRNA nucleotidyltransferase (CCA-adding enzyme)|nr:hypothetical protein [Deltaproteobacteria bacterium]
MKYYLAGGAVRNLLLGIKPADLDFAFNGSEQEFIALNPLARKLGGGPALLLGRNEYSPLRGEDLTEDLRKRDFTINALLLDENGVLHMHPDALRDLKAGCLEAASEDALTEDPLRVFRAARFSAVFPELRVSEHCRNLLRESASLEAFRNIAAERVGQECLKALSGPCPGNFLRLLGETGTLTHWFKEFSGASGIPAGPVPYHNTDVLEHTAQIMDSTAAGFDSWRAGFGVLHEREAAEHIEQVRQAEQAAYAEIRQLSAWMALCHDLGKTGTPAEILPHHYKHELRGMKLASALALRLRLPERFRLAGVLASKLHMKAGVYFNLRPGTRVDLLMEVHARKLIIPLFLLAQADSGNNALLGAACAELEMIKEVKLPNNLKNQGKISGQRLRELRCQRLGKLSEQCFSAPAWND